MIYLDSLASSDNPVMPADRKEPCINCGEMWGYHRGWSCHAACPNQAFNTSKKCYMTKSMRDSIQAQSATTTQHVITGIDLAADNSSRSTTIDVTTKVQKSQECPCGIVRADCTYHKD